jgi:hypothetical protein
MLSEVVMPDQENDGDRNNTPAPLDQGRPPIELKVRVVQIECDAVADKGSFNTSDKVCCLVSVGVGYSYKRIGRHKIGEYFMKGRIRYSTPI